MKLPIIAVTLAVCSAQNSRFDVWPPESSRLVTENFTSQLKAIMMRDWYARYPVHQRAHIADVYQIGDAVSNESNVFASLGFGLSPGKMTQYKFSFIGDSANCVIGFTPPTNFGYSESGPVLNLSTAAFKGRGFFKSDYLNDIGKDSDDVDWFIDNHEDGYVQVYMTLNGEPLGEAFRMSFDITDEDLAANTRPLLLCRDLDTIDPKKGIAVIQYSPVPIPRVRPYAKRRKSDVKHFILKNLGDRFPDGFKGKTFEESDVIKIKVKDQVISIIDGYTETHCHVKFLPDHVSSIKVSTCGRGIMGYDPEPFKSLLFYMIDFLRNTDRYEWLPSGDLLIHSKYGVLVFNSLEPVDASPNL